MTQLDMTSPTLDQRGTPRVHSVGARRRRGVPADLPAPRGTHPRLVVRLERPPDAAGGRRRGRLRAEGRIRGSFDAQELEHRAQPRVHGRAGRRNPAAARARGAPARPAADPLHRQPG